MREIEVGRRTQGMGFMGLLLLVLITLKLTDCGAVGAWSWWTVFTPLWGPIAAGLTLRAIGASIDASRRREERRRAAVEAAEREVRRIAAAEEARQREAVPSKTSEMMNRVNQAYLHARRSELERRSDRAWDRIERGDY